VAEFAGQTRLFPFRVPDPRRNTIMDDDVFESVDWDNSNHTVPSPQYPTGPQSDTLPEYTTSQPGFRQSLPDDTESDPQELRWEGYLVVNVRNPTHELAGSKDAYISYEVTANVSSLHRSA